MDLHEWEMFNADDKSLGVVVTSGKNRHAASEKVYHIFGAKSIFIKLVYMGRRAEPWTN